ncbi:MAG TPA: hypothetical protein DDZ88_14640 [Verrucomicrobiales bacterium]|nr:hypothetical protein [Verrucomicrobiales bacterium]
MAGTLISYLRHRSGEDAMVTLLIAWALGFLLLFRSREAGGPALFLVPWLCAVALACAAFFYCWPRASLAMGALAGISSVVLMRRQFSGPARSVLIFGVIVAFSQWIVFVADHVLLGGRFAAFKWSHIEHPFFGTPYEIRPTERSGRKAIYVFDRNGADPAAVALVWGWSLFPKFIDLDEARPEGSMMHLPEIQEVIR